MANLEKKDDKKEKKKDGMASAVSSTEKIRTWNEHMIEIDQLAKQLETTIKKHESTRAITD